MNRKIAAFVARHRNARLLSKLDRMAVRFHQAYENFDYNLETNGEAVVLQKLKELESLSTIFDVGANVGDWSRMAASYFSGATIYSFEIVPQTYKQMLVNLSGTRNVVHKNIGMSDAPGTATVFFSPECDFAATCVPGITEGFHKLQPQEIMAVVSTGDIFCAEAGIRSIDYLKLDVEGFEPRVLKGFEGMLKRSQIKIIQFEYGYVNASVHFLLKDFYDYLGGFGMKLGKIYPNHVDFRDYRFAHEDFNGPNYLAVHSSCADFIGALR